LTLVTAPAGYGKSTLVSHWLQNCESPSAWVSLDDSDSDARLFLDYLVEAIRSMFPSGESRPFRLKRSA
jgi:LuxR family maltose regulon positive regulatory protein